MFSSYFAREKNILQNQPLSESTVMIEEDVIAESANDDERQQDPQPRQTSALWLNADFGH
jgi:hypothetical protein